MEAARTERTQTNSEIALVARRVEPTRTVTSPVRAAPRYSGPPALRLSSATGAAPEGVPAAVSQLVSSPGPGEAMQPQVQQALESNLGADLRTVRVHTNSRASAAAESLGARAFTYGPNIFLGAGERSSDLALMAHEVTHVIQQRGAPVLQMSSAASVPDTLEQEAQQVAATAQHGGPVVVTGQTQGPQVQKEELSWWQKGKGAVGKGMKAAGAAVVSGAEAVVELGGDLGWSLLNRYAPDLVPIIRQGVGEWLKEKISAAVETVFNTLMAPVRAVTGVVESLSAHFKGLLAWMQDAAAKIAKGDCGPISEAAEKIQKVIDGFASPIIDRVKQLAQKVGKFFNDLWDRFGAPAWDFLKKAGGQAWERIRQFSSWVWTKTEPIRKTVSRAWTWIKNKLGIGEGPEGQDGLLQWVQRNASAAWNVLKTKIEPFKKPLLVVARILLMLTPAGPFIAIGTGVAKLMAGIRWIRQHWHTPEFVVKMRETLHDTVIPGILGAVSSVKATLTHVSTVITSKLNDLMGGLGQIVKAVSDPFLRFTRSAVQWIIDQFRGLAHWASERLTALASWIGKGLEHLRTYLQPVWQVVRKIIGFVANPFSGLQGLLVGTVWKLLPKCLKSPIINFILDVLIAIVRLSRFLPEPYMLGALFLVLKTVMLGFLQRIRSSFLDDAKIKIADRFAKLASEGSFEFAKGFLWGLVLGIWDGIKGPFVLIWDIIKLIGGVFRFLWRTIQTLSKPETLRRLLQELEGTWQTIQTKIVPAIEELLSGRTNPAKIIDFIRGIVGKVLDAAKGAGASIADALLGFLQEPDEWKFGKSIGWLYGTILFEVILIVLTYGGYSLKSIVQKLASTVSEAVLKVAKFLEQIKTYLPKIIEAIQGISKFASNNRAMQAMLDAVKEFLRRLVQFLDIAYGLAGAEERAAARAVAEAERLAGGVRYEIKFIDSITGKTHHIKLLANGKIMRCSDRCLELVLSIRERSVLLKRGLKPTSELRSQAAALTERAKAIAKLPEAERLAREAELLKEAERLEKQMLMIEGLPKKVGDAAQLERLLKKTENAAQLERLLGKTENAAQLERFLTRVDNPAELERLLGSSGLRPGAPDPSRLDRVLQKMGPGKQKVSEVEAALNAQKKIDSKILYAERSFPSEPLASKEGKKIRGGHSPRILTDPDHYQIERQIANADGTIYVKFRMLLSPGPPQIWSKPSFSTVPPPSWTDLDILRAGDRVAKTPPVFVPGPNLNNQTAHRSIINGIEWEVIKDSSGNIVASWPTGGRPIQILS
jgi:phage-related protein